MKGDELVKYRKAIITPIPATIPRDKIKLEKLKDGYKVAVTHEMEEKDTGGFSKSFYSFSTEEHYGVDVKDLKGQFNDDGKYEIFIRFDDEY